jgi:hypothetical protein
MFPFSNRFLAFSLLLLNMDSHSGVQAREEYLKSIGDCFVDSDAVEDTLSCLSDYTDCFDSTTISEIEICLESSTMEECLAPYVDCIQAEVQVVVDSLPECVNTTIVALGDCYIDNASICNSTCSKDDIPQENPYEDADAASLVFCSPFQSDIMDPSCEIVDCCAECIAEFEALMNCIVQDVMELELEPPDSGDCVVSCPESRRALSADGRDLQGGETENHKSEDILGECGVYLETEAGSVGGMTEGSFQQCLFNNLFVLLPENAGSSVPGSGSRALDNKKVHVMALTMFVVVVRMLN